MKLRLDLQYGPLPQTQRNKVKSGRMPWQSMCYPGRNIRQTYDYIGGKTRGNAIDKTKEILQVILCGRNPPLGRNGLSGGLLETCQGKERTDSLSLHVQGHHSVHNFLGHWSSWCYRCRWLWKDPGFAPAEQGVRCLVLLCPRSPQAANAFEEGVATCDVCVSWWQGKGQLCKGRESENK